MATNASCEVSINGGAYTATTNGIDCSSGDTISIRLVDNSDVNDWYLEVIGTDELSSTPSLTNVNPTTHLVVSPATVVTFTYPGGTGRAVGIKSTGVGTTTEIKTFGIYSLAAGNTYRTGFVGEITEGSTDFGWITKLNPLLRGGGFIAGGDISGSKLVTGLRGQPINSTAPTSNQVYVFSGSQWLAQQLTLDPELIGPAFAVTLSGGGLVEVGSYVNSTYTDITATVTSSDTLTVTNTAGFVATDIVIVDNGGTFMTATVTSVPDSTTLVLSVVFPSLPIGAYVTKAPSFTATYNYAATAATISNNQNGIVDNIISTPTSFKTSTSFRRNTYGSTVSYTLTANKGAIVRTSSTVFTWAQKVFYGVGSAGQTSEAFLEGLATSTLATSRARTFTVNAGAGEKIYYAYRLAFGTATFTIGGFEGGFGSPTTVSVTNAHGFTEDYYLYESENANLGSTTVVVT